MNKEHHNENKNDEEDTLTLAKLFSNWYVGAVAGFALGTFKGDLTESSKSPASIAQSNKQWVGTCLYQEWCKPLLISCEAAFGYEQVAKRIANIRLTNSEYRFGYWSYCKLDI